VADKEKVVLGIHAGETAMQTLYFSRRITLPLDGDKWGTLSLRASEQLRKRI
jgi:hypothetical protein